MVPACHDILVFGLWSRCRSADGCCEVGECPAVRAGRSLEVVKNARLSVTRSIAGFHLPFLQDAESWREDCLGEHGVMVMMMGAPGLLVRLQVVQLHVMEIFVPR